MTDRTDQEKQDEFAAYFRSEAHERRMAESMERHGAALGALAMSDPFQAFSEAIGMAFAVGNFYRRLGLKHQAAKVFMGIYSWLKKGTD